MWRDRWNRWSGPLAVGFVILVVLGLIGLTAMISSAPDRSLSSLRERLEPGDKARLAGTVRDVIAVNDDVTALTIFDESTRKDPLLVLSGDPDSVNADGKTIAIKGKIERFDPATFATRYGAPFDDARLSPFAGQVVIVGESLDAKTD